MKYVRDVIFLLCMIPISSTSGQDTPEGTTAQLESDLINVKMRCREYQREMNTRVDSLRQELVTVQDKLKISNGHLRESQQVAAKANSAARACKESLAKVAGKEPAKPLAPTLSGGHLQIERTSMPVMEDTLTQVVKAPNSSGPNLQRPPAYSNGGSGAGKADQVISPLAFPKVPKNTDWLDAHLNEQMALLNRLYTGSALQSLASQQQQFCGNSKPSPYCVMQLRLYWISSAL